MALTATAFMRAFGIDEPMGCYDDFDHADAFALWGSNMAEMHPILWTRLADHRLGTPGVQCAVLSTFTHRSMDLAATGADNPGLMVDSGFEAFKAHVAEYSLEYASGLTGVEPVSTDRATFGLWNGARGRNLCSPAACGHGCDQPRSHRHRQEEMETAGGPVEHQTGVACGFAGPDAQGWGFELLLGSGEQ